MRRGKRKSRRERKPGVRPGVRPLVRPPNSASMGKDHALSFEVQTQSERDDLRTEDEPLLIDLPGECRVVISEATIPPPSQVSSRIVSAERGLIRLENCHFEDFEDSDGFWERVNDFAQLSYEGRSARLDFLEELWRQEITTTALDVGLFQTDDSQPLRVEGFQSLCRELVTRLLKNPGEIYNLSPHLFEELVMDRVSEMGLDVIRVSSTNRADGGVDFVFRSKGGTPVPIIGAVQVKHHQRAQIKTGVEVVEKLAGVLQRHRDAFNLGMVVTNTSFSSEAEWFAHPLQLWLRLRDGADVLHWIRGDFQNRREGDELPQSVRLTRNLLVDLKKR